MRVAIFNDTRTPNAHFGCSIVMSNLEFFIARAGGEVVWRWPAGKDWRECRDLLPSPGSVDLVLVNGEGTIHHSDSNWRAVALVDVAEYARNVLCVPSYLINATLYQNTSALYSKIKCFDGVFVRDSLSLSELRQHGVSGVLVPDLTLTFSRAIGDELPVRCGVAVTDSVFSSLSKTLKKFSLSNGFDYRAMTLPRKIKFYPRDFINPLLVIKKVKSFFLQSFSRRRNGGADDFIVWLSKKALVVTGRYHTVTLCLLTSTPFFAMESNTPKISSLLVDVFGEASRVIPSVECVQVGSVFSPTELAAIDRYLDFAAKSCGEMFAHIFTAHRRGSL